ncbi:MAG: hypothetical protein N3D16_12960, partial [Anaerolineales bacterium]|nr:hypothetical protein [Anaerolineales bacterium]
ARIVAQASSLTASDLTFRPQTDDSVPCVALTKDAIARTAVLWDEYLVISQGGGSCTVGFYQGRHDSSPKFVKIMPWVLNEPCQLEPSWSNAETSSISFYGYEAMLYRVSLSTGVNEAEERGMIWCMPVGENLYRFKIETTSINVAEYGPADDPMPLAEAIYSLAESYLGVENTFGNQSQPGELGDGFDLPPETSDTQQDEWAGESPPQSDLSTPPTLVVVGNIAIPLLGSLLGALIASFTGTWGSVASSTITSSATAVQSAGISKLTQMNNTAGWTEHSATPASPLGVTRQPPHPPTKIFQAGTQWEIGSLETDQPNPKQPPSSAPPLQRGAATRDKQPSSQSEKQKSSPETNQPDIRPLEMRLVDFQEEIYSYRDELEKKYYVANPWQGDPTMVMHRARCISNLVYDKTIGKLTSKQGLTCSEYVEQTANRVAESLKKHLPNARLESVVFDERSSLDPKGWKDWLDSTVEDNHNLLRVILPDGSEWAIDFHQNRARNAPLFRKFDEARREWRNYIGEKEFVERVSFVISE